MHTKQSGQFIRLDKKFQEKFLMCSISFLTLTLFLWFDSWCLQFMKWYESPEAGGIDTFIC